MSVNTPLRELILINVGRVNYIMQTIAEDVGDLAAKNERLRAQNASLEAEAEELRAGRGRWPDPSLVVEGELNASEAEWGEESIRDHVAYLRDWIPRSEWSRNDQRIVRLSAKIDAVLRELNVKRSEPRDDFDRGADAARAMIRRAIEEAGKA